MKLCIRCHTENPIDAIFCSQCGMSLTWATVGEESEVQDTTRRKAKWMRHTPRASERSCLGAEPHQIGRREMSKWLEKRWWIFFVAIPVLSVCVPVVFYLCLCVLNPHPPSRCYFQF